MADDPRRGYGPVIAAGVVGLLIGRWSNEPDAAPTIASTPITTPAAPASDVTDFAPVMVDRPVGGRVPDDAEPDFGEVLVGRVVYYQNCAAARAAGAAPIRYGQPGYARKLDRDGDGVACEYPAMCWLGLNAHWKELISCWSG